MEMRAGLVPRFTIKQDGDVDNDGLLGLDDDGDDDERLTKASLVHWVD